MDVEVGRRRFLSRTIAAIQGVIAAGLGAVLGTAVASPSLAPRREHWVAAGRVLDLIDEEPTPVTIRVVRDDGYREVVDRHVVFLVKSGHEVKALSSTCSHLGCRVSWNVAERMLRCPCHGGAFDATGAVVGGPPPAGLAVLATRVDQDQVMVQL